MAGYILFICLLMAFSVPSGLENAMAHLSVDQQIGKTAGRNINAKLPVRPTGGRKRRKIK